MKALVGIGAVAIAVMGSMGCSGSSSSGAGSGSGATGGTAITMSPANLTALPNGVVGQVYSQTVTVISGGTAPYVLAPTGLPAGLSWSSTPSSGTLSGTPTQIGVGTFQVTITDATGAQASVGYPLTIEAAGGVMTIAPSALPGGTLNASYSATLEVIGGTAPYNFTTKGNLPPGVLLGPGGARGQAALSGTPVAQGTYSFTVNVSDASSPVQNGTINYSITVQ